jgi:antitoxin (DNA-binding transcriptional repressor) of toxin-antitoxin stability system
MNITATQFQLSVNEYFSKLSQGEDIVISRYGRPFARLVPFEEKAEDDVTDETAENSKLSTPKVDIEEVKEKSETESTAVDLSKSDLVKIVKLLIK